MIIIKIVTESDLREAIEKIRALPNRDDKLYGKNGVAFAILDGGGVGRFEVIHILEKLLEAKK